MANNFMGKDGFIWWNGVVEDRFDPLFLGRCKVRILGFHTEDKRDMPTGLLPWAFPLMPITSGSQTGVGQSPTGPVEGTWVMGYFRDGEAGQEPVMMGTFHGIPENTYTKNVGFNDPRNDDVLYNQLAPNAEGKSAPLAEVPKKVPVKVGFRKLEAGVEASVVNLEVDAMDGPSDPKAYMYPQNRYLDEPTTSRYARGFSDTSSKIKPDPPSYTSSGDLKIEKNEGILQYKKDNLFKTIDVADPVKNALPANKINEPMSAFNPTYPYNHVYESESGHLIEIDDTPGAERLHWFHRSGTFTEIFPRGTKVDKVVGHNYKLIAGHDLEVVKGAKKSTIFQGKQELISSGGSYNRINGGNYNLNVSKGSANLTTGTSFNVTSTGDVTINTRGKFSVTANEFEQVYQKANAGTTISGSYLETVLGTRTIDADDIVLNSATGKITESCGSTRTVTVGGNYEETINNTLTFFLGNLNAKKTTAIAGKIVNETMGLETFGTGGGIDNFVGKSGLINKISQSPMLLGGGIDIVSNGPLGINISANMGLASFKAMLINEIEGKIMLKLKSEGLVKIDAPMAMINGTSDFAVLALKLMKWLATHTHLTSNGPSGPPVEGGALSDIMSKKVMLG